MFSRRTTWNLAINRYTEALENLRREGRELLDLTASNPTTAGLKYHENELLRAFTHHKVLTYEPSSKGLLSAREAVGAYYAEKGIPVQANDLILTTSTSEAYSFIFRLLCDPGDAILVPTPSYPLFDFLADLNDVKLVPYELVYDHGWQMDFHSLHGARRRAEADGLRCRAVLVVHPNNPTGSYVKADEAAELGKLCAAHRLAIVADEVFLDYSLGPDAPITFAANSEALTFTLSGLSKISGLPQMKVAWIVTSGSGHLKQDALARLEVIADTYLSMSTPTQLALTVLLDERHTVQAQLMRRIHANMAELDTQLSCQSLCNRLVVEGGWYAALRVPVLGSDEDLAIDLLQNAGVLVQPGHFFNFPGEGYLIISLITPAQEFAAGIRRMLQNISRR
jgi:aspartate/methionine/tyrosine aminotransferase